MLEIIEKKLTLCQLGGGSKPLKKIIFGLDIIKKDNA